MEDIKTVFCGNLDNQVTEELLYELFLQVAPIERVKIPTDREGRKSNYGFVTFKHESSVQYAIVLLNGTRLFQKGLTIKPRNGGIQQNLQQNIHRSTSFPNNNNRRSNELADLVAAHLRSQSHDDLRMSPTLNFHNNFPQMSYGNDFGNNNRNNRNNNRSTVQWDKNTNRDKERNHNSRKEYEREKDRRNDGFKGNINRKNSDRRNNFDKHIHKRNNKRY